MTLPQTIALNAVYEGTTWEGISSITLTNASTGQAINLTSAEITMIYRRVGERASRLTLTVGNGILITNPNNGVFKVLDQILPLTAGLYYWELMVKLSSGIAYAFLVGTQEIVKVGVPK